MMRYLLLVAGLLIGLPATGQTIPDQRTLEERLDLSEATAAAVHDALTAVEQRPGFLWTVSAELADRLSDEQKAELLAAAPDRTLRLRGAERGQRHEWRGAPRRARMRHHRDLSEEQRNQLREVRQRFTQQLNELREGHAEMDTFRERHRELRSEMRAAMDAVRAQQRPRAAGMRPDSLRQRRVEESRMHQERRLRMHRHSDRSLDEARRTRRDAPGLTDEQRDKLRTPTLQRRPVADARRAEVLTDEKREIIRIHAALQRVVRHLGNR